MHRIPERTPVKRMIVTRPTVESVTAVCADEESPGSIDDLRLGEETPILVEAEEALRIYHQNILLVGEALLTLELMERGALDESEQRIVVLTQSFPDKESAVLIRTLLSHWLSRTRTVSGRRPSEPLTPESRIEARAGRPESVHKTVASLKREGLQLYSRGDLNGAVSCWRRIRELDPADTETRQFLQRAKAILKNRRADV